jgi:hypothetical protein
VHRVFWWGAACTVATLLIGCDLLPSPQPARIEGCPYSADEARQAELGDEVFIGLGHVIRYVPSEGDPTYRGYDVTVAETIAGRPYINETIFLQVESPVAGIGSGDPVVVVAERIDRTVVYVPGRCVPLVQIDEEDVVVR